MRAPSTFTVAAVSLSLATAACSGKGKHGGKKDEPSPAETPSGAPSGASAAGASGTAVAPAPGASGRPNILFVVADDQRADSVACLPRLQKMFAGGVTFTSYFASTPLCCPGRTTLLTGKYAHNHGVLQNGDVEDGEKTRTPGALDFVKNGNDQRLIARWLQGAGYRTAMFGKYLNGYDVMLKKETYAPPYWDDWHVFSHAEYFDFQLVERSKGEKDATRTCVLSGTSKGGKKGEKRCREKADRVIEDGKENYSTDVLKEKAIAFIRSAAKEKTPFFMYFAPKSPHGPFLSPARYQPDPRETRFTADAMEKLGSCSLFDWKDRPASYEEKDVSDKPGWIQDLAGKHGKKDLDDVRKGQLVSVLASEDALAEMLEALDDVGQRANTILVYVSDNGYAWGEHGYKGKNCPYESCSHVPFLFKDPRSAAAARTFDGFVADIDIAPTFAALAGATIPATDKVDGTSLVPILNDPKAAWAREELLTECWGNGEKGHPDTLASVRTKKWLYVEHYVGDDRTKVAMRGGRGELELYDLEKDPFELDNLLALPEPELVATGHDRSSIGRTASGMHTRLGILQNAKK